jgi:hypothetical protein
MGSRGIKAKSKGAYGEVYLTLVARAHDTRVCGFDGKNTLG